jgi:hypothetical protein
MADMRHDDEFAARECAHPDCDGWRMHSVDTRRLDDGTYEPFCPLGCDLGVIGSASTPDTARRMAPDHNQSVRCEGECRAW